LARTRRAFAAIGGVPRLLVPDNAKVAVIKACLYEPQVNRTYAEMAAHYGTAVLPTRPHRPRDKAKVEAAVLIIERWIELTRQEQNIITVWLQGYHLPEHEPAVIDVEWA
jgi:transposase